MFKFLKNLFKREVKEVKEVQSVKETGEVKHRPQTVDNSLLGLCTCGRKTVHKKNKKFKDKNGNVSYEFKITCPKCSRVITGYGTNLQASKKDAFEKWNTK